MLQSAGLPSGVRAVEAVRSAAQLYANPYSVAELIERLDLGRLSRRPFRRLSGGEQQRVGLAVALVGRPELLLLDEPTSGMDPVVRRDTWELIRDVADQGATVVVTTHQIDEAAAVADEVALIASGRCVVQDSPAHLTRGSSVLEFTATPALDLRTFASDGHRVVEATPGRYRVESNDDAGLLEAVVAWCTEQGTSPTEVVTRRRSLEDVVIELIEWDGSDER
jgi:ABC-2 type transport system ATP-binding protein